MFDKKKNIIKKISTFLKFNYKKKKWRNLNYDLYGKIKDYNTTFEKYDDKINILNPITKKLLKRLIKSNFRSLNYLLLFKISYFIDSLKFNFLISNYKIKN